MSHCPLAMLDYTIPVDNNRDRDIVGASSDKASLERR